jgi:glycosyltransferase involved in cell wall biosynthesis
MSGCEMSKPFGVNLAGNFESETGLGEGARAMMRALEAAGVPFLLNNAIDEASANTHRLRESFQDVNPYRFNIAHINADLFPRFARNRGRDYFRERYTIGLWAWELTHFPTHWNDAFRFVDEVWCPSTFAQQSVASAASVPVRCIPHAIETLNVDCERCEFGLPRDAFVFLFAFAISSSILRKNPLALIQAFRSAFGERGDVVLVLKTMHDRCDPKARELLGQACAGSANLRLIDGVLDRAAMSRLMQMSDAVVSLHRCEGFGLLLAEAMAMGKPAIGTAYSGNLDFMTADNSILVPYKLIANDVEWGPFPRGVVWADPDVSHAAASMRRLVEDREWGRCLGERARADMARDYNPRRIGERIRARLLEIAAQGLPPSRPTARLSSHFFEPVVAQAGPSRRFERGRRILGKVRRFLRTLILPPDRRRAG